MWDVILIYEYEGGYVEYNQTTDQVLRLIETTENAVDSIYPAGTSMSAEEFLREQGPK